MDNFVTSFIKTQRLQPLVWFRCIDDIFFIRTHDEEELRNFLKSQMNLMCVLLTYESNKENISFLELCIKLIDRHQ